MAKSPKNPRKQNEEYPDANQRRDYALRNALAMPPKPKKAKKKTRKK